MTTPGTANVATKDKTAEAADTEAAMFKSNGKRSKPADANTPAPAAEVSPADKINLEDLNRDDLVLLSQRITAAIHNWDTKRKDEALAAARKLAEDYGYSLDDLMPGGGSSKPAKPHKIKTASSGTPKYRNPANPEETWTGHGRRPKWIIEMQNSGKDLSEFEIIAA